VLGLGVGGRRRESGGAVEQRVGALVGEFTDRRRLESGLQQAGAQSVQAQRGQPHHAVPGDVGVVQRRGGLLVGVGHQRLVDRPVLHEPHRLQHPEPVVQPHHRVGDLLEDVVGGLRHVAGHDHRRGEGGQRHHRPAGFLLADGHQVQVAEHGVEELRLGLRLPVQRVEVEFAGAVLRGDGVDQLVQVGDARVGEHGLQGGEPHPEHVLRRAAGEPCQPGARGHRALLLVDHLDEPGVHGDPPRLTGVGGGVLAGQPEFRGGRRKLLLGEPAPGVDPGLRAGPAGQPGRPGEHGGGQGVARQLRFGAQPCGRQGGAV
jgi:hypothetical protein